MTSGVSTSWDGPDKALHHPGHINWFRDGHVFQARLTLPVLVRGWKIFYTASRMLFLKGHIIFLSCHHFTVTRITSKHLPRPIKPLQSDSCLSRVSDHLLFLYIHFTLIRTGYTNFHFRSCASTLLSPCNILSLDHLVAFSHNSSCLKSNAP